MYDELYVEWMARRDTGCTFSYMDVGWLRGGNRGTGDATAWCGTRCRRWSCSGSLSLLCRRSGNALRSSGGNRSYNTCIN